MPKKTVYDNMKYTHTRIRNASGVRCGEWSASVRARARACVCERETDWAHIIQSSRGKRRTCPHSARGGESSTMKPGPENTLIIPWKRTFYRQNTFFKDILHLHVLLCARARCPWTRNIGIWVRSCWTEEDFIRFHFWGENSLSWCQRREKIKKRH